MGTRRREDIRSPMIFGDQAPQFSHGAHFKPDSGFSSKPPPSVPSKARGANNTPSAPYVSSSLYVGDLSQEVTEALLFEKFNAVGPVASVRVCRDASTRRSLGYAYVNFHKVNDAERALDTMNFMAIRGKPCRIMWCHRDPRLRKSGLGNIFVKNLSKTIDNKALYDTFSIFGNILSCKVATGGSGESLGYGFVHYENQESANEAKAKVNGKIIAGLKVYVGAFKSKKDRAGTKYTFTNIYVKNIPTDWIEDHFVKFFSKYGPITSAMLAQDKDGKYKGFGFANYEKHSQAVSAVESAHGLLLQPDKRLYVARAQKRSERENYLRDRFSKLKQQRRTKFVGVNLYIKNLNESFDDQRLRAEFEKFGTITSSKLMKNTSGFSRGFGFVCFASPEEATRAIREMNGRMLDGKPLYVALAQRKEDRRAQLEQYYSRARAPGTPWMPFNPATQHHQQHQRSAGAPHHQQHGHQQHQSAYQPPMQPPTAHHRPQRPQRPRHYTQQPNYQPPQHHQQHQQHQQVFHQTQPAPMPQLFYNVQPMQRHQQHHQQPHHQQHQQHQQVFEIAHAGQPPPFNMAQPQQYYR